MVPKKEYKSTNENIEELNLKPIFNFFFRYKYSISFFIFLGGLVGYVNFLRTPKVWEGQFQIVVSENVDSIAPSGSNRIENRFINNIQKNEINTQIIILKSPSVLYNIFNFTKNKNNENELNFESWKKRISVERERNSSVLNIKYKDSNKEIILPVLNKISSLYQQYSNEKRLKSVELKIKFLQDEIEKYRNLTYDSIIKSQDYSKEYAITASTNQDEEIISIVTDVEENSSKARALIKEIDQKLKNIKSITNNDELIYYANIYNLAGPARNELLKIDKKILDYSIQFQDEDLLIANLKDKKIELSKNLRQVLISSLETVKDNASLILDANNRDSEIIFTYKKLLIESIKNARALESLENQLLSLNIEKSREEEPWDLITKPYLFPYYLYPNKLKNILVGGGIFLILSTLFLLILERSKNIITRKDEIEEIIKSNKIFQLTLSNNQVVKSELELLNASLEFNTSDKFIFYSLDHNDNTLIKNISNSFKNEVLVSDKIPDLAKYKKIILMITLNVTEKQSLYKFKEIIDILKLEVVSLIIISNYIELK